MSKDNELFKDFTGLWIPRKIWLDDKLNNIQKLFLAEINSLDNKNGCFASNSYFARFFNLTPQRSSQVINELIRANYLKVKYKYNGKEVDKRVLNVLDRYKENIEGGIKNILRGYQEYFKDITKDITKVYNKKDVYFPDHLTNDLFKSKWEEWALFRKEIGKSLKDMSIRKQIKLLGSYNCEDAIKIIDTSILSSWQGLFPLKTVYKKSEDNRSDAIKELINEGVING